MSVFRNLIQILNNKLIYVNSPNDISGCCFWVDGLCNTRNGLDHSKEYMEDLVGCFNNSETLSYYDIYGGDSCGTWDGNFLKLSNWMAFSMPQLGTNNSSSINYNFTYEVLIIHNSDDVSKSSTNSGYTWITGANSDNGFLLRSDNANESLVSNSCSITLQMYNISNSLIQFNPIPINDKTPTFYTMKYLNGVLYEYINGNLIQQNSIVFNFPQYYHRLGVGVQGYFDNNVPSNIVNNISYSGLSIGMLRMWSKSLSDEQIYENYLDTKKRFNL